MCVGIVRVKLYVEVVRGFGFVGKVDVREREEGEMGDNRSPRCVC